MRTVLSDEIKKERCNAAALGAYNASVGSSDTVDKTEQKKGNFNESFYQPNRSENRESAEKRLTELGYKDFSFKGISYSNGFSAYFTDKNGKEIRVSDHPLTGRRAFETTQVSIREPKKLPTPFALEDKMKNKEISFKEYKQKIKEFGFVQRIKKDPFK